MPYMSIHWQMQTNITHGVVFLNSCIPLQASVGLQISYLPTEWPCLRYPSAPCMTMYISAQPILLKPLHFIVYKFCKCLFILTTYKNRFGLFLNLTDFYLSHFKSRRLTQMLREKWKKNPTALTFSVITLFSFILDNVFNSCDLRTP